MSERISTAHHWLEAKDVQVGDLVLDFEGSDGCLVDPADQFYVEVSREVPEFGLWDVEGEDGHMRFRWEPNRLVEVMR